MATFSLEWLLEYREYLDFACKNPCHDEDVHELRRSRRLVAEAIAARM
jgi:hypothetical protein